MTTTTPIILNDKVVNIDAHNVKIKAVIDSSTATDNDIKNTKVESNSTAVCSDSASAASLSSKSYIVSASGFIYKSIASLFDDVPALKLAAKPRDNSSLSATTLELPTDTTGPSAVHKPSNSVPNKLKKNSVVQDKKLKLKNAVPAPTANRAKSSAITSAAKEAFQSA